MTEGHERAMTERWAGHERAMTERWPGHERAMCHGPSVYAAHDSDTARGSGPAGPSGESCAAHFRDPDGDSAHEGKMATRRPCQRPIGHEGADVWPIGPVSVHGCHGGANKRLKG